AAHPRGVGDPVRATRSTAEKRIFAAKALDPGVRGDKRVLRLPKPECRAGSRGVAGARSAPPVRPAQKQSPRDAPSLSQPQSAPPAPWPDGRRPTGPFSGHGPRRPPEAERPAARTKSRTWNEDARASSRYG